MRPESIRPRPAIIQFSKRPLKFWDAEPGQFKRNTLKRHLSVEIECDSFKSDGDGKPLAKVLKKWSDSVVHDGSLGGGLAHEINVTPSNGDLFPQHIEEISEAYKGIKGKCTSRCGLHVHVNCSDLKFYDLRKVILLYAKVERAMFELCAPGRIDSSYSKLCGENYANMSPEPENFRRQLFGKFYLGERINSARPDKNTGLAIAKAKQGKYSGVRYRALNLHSYFLRKTIEFRHHEGSTDAGVIINWAMVCGHLIEAANRLSEAQIRELPKDSREALLTILPNELKEWCKLIWKDVKVDWNKWNTSTNKPDLPAIPKDEILADKKVLRKKFKAERKARAKINQYRTASLRAIIQGVRLNIPSQSPPAAQTRAAEPTPEA